MINTPHSNLLHAHRLKLRTVLASVRGCLGLERVTGAVRVFISNLLPMKKTLTSALLGGVVATGLILGTYALAATNTAVTAPKGFSVISNIQFANQTVTKLLDKDNNVVCYTYSTANTGDGISCVDPK